MQRANRRLREIASYSLMTRHPVRGRCLCRRRSAVLSGLNINEFQIVTKVGRALGRFRPSGEAPTQVVSWSTARRSTRRGAESFAAQTVLAYKLVEGAAILLRNSCGERDVAAGPGQDTVKVGLLEFRHGLRLGGLECAVGLTGRDLARHLAPNRAQLDHIAFGKNQFT